MNQLLGESKMEFEERKKFFDFLSSKKIKNKEKITKIYCNIKYRNCRYSASMYHYIKRLEKEYSSN